MDHNTFNTVSGFDAQKYYQRKIEPMIGVDSFKELMKEIIDIEPRIQQDNTYDIFLHQYYLFSMEDGSYIEDYLQIMRDVVSLKGMMTITSDSNAEYIRVPILKEKSDLYQSACDCSERAPTSSALISPTGCQNCRTPISGSCCCSLRITMTARSLFSGSLIWIPRSWIRYTTSSATSSPYGA